MAEYLPKYLKKSRQIFRINGALILLTIILAFLTKNVFKVNNAFLDFFGGLPVLLIFVLAPMGIFYT